MKHYTELSLEEIEDRVKRRNQFTHIETFVEKTGSIHLHIRCDEYLWLIEKVKEYENHNKTLI